MSPALAAALAGLRPVPMRRPWLSLVTVAVLSVLWAAGFDAFVVLGGFGPMQPRHVTHGPVGWTVGVGAVWLALFVGALALALVPPRRQVMPDARRAWRFGATSLVVIVAVALLSSLHGAGAPPPTPLELLEQPRTPHCLAGALFCALMPLVLGLRELRGARPLRAWTVGMALGVAAGALGGLHLHLACPVATGTFHFLAGHAAPALVAGALGAGASVWLARGPRG
jgi:hypothetical protein